MTFPLSAVLYSLCFNLAIWDIDHEGDFIETILGGGLTGLIGMPFGFIGILIYGMPSFLLLKKIGKATWWATILVALLPWFIYDILVSPYLFHFIEFGFYSTVSALTFYFFAKRNLNIVANET